MVGDASIREGLYRTDRSSIIGDDQLATSPMQEDGEWNYDKFEQAIILMQEHSLFQFSWQSGDEIVHSMASE